MKGKILLVCRKFLRYINASDTKAEIKVGQPNSRAKNPKFEAKFLVIDWLECPEARENVPYSERNT